MDLPAELLLMIMSVMGEGSRRSLRRTCSSLNEIYKSVVRRERTLILSGKGPDHMGCWFFPRCNCLSVYQFSVGSFIFRDSVVFHECICEDMHIFDGPVQSFLQTSSRRRQEVGIYFVQITAGHKGDHVNGVKCLSPLYHDQFRDWQSHDSIIVLYDIYLHARLTISNTNPIDGNIGLLQESSMSGPFVAFVKVLFGSSIITNIPVSLLVFGA